MTEMEVGDEIEIESSPSLWGQKITSDKPTTLQSGLRRLVVFRATLEKGSSAQLFLKIKDQKYSLGTLSKDKKETFRLDIELFEGTNEEYELSVVGDGTVAVIGSYSPEFGDDFSEDDFSDLSDSEDLPAEPFTKPKNPKPAAKLPPAQSAGQAKKAAAAKPAGGAAPKTATKPASPAKPSSASASPKTPPKAATGKPVVKRQNSGASPAGKKAKN